VRDGLGVDSIGAGGVVRSVSRTSMVKRTIGTGGMFLGASGRGVSEAVALDTLGVSGSLCRFLYLEAFLEGVEGREEDGNVVGVN